MVALYRGETRQEHRLAGQSEADRLYMDNNLDIVSMLVGKSGKKWGNVLKTLHTLRKCRYSRERKRI